MISVKEALELIDAHCHQQKDEEVELVNALDKVLSRDVISPINMPPFSQSAMDGYAVCFDDTLSNSFTLTGEIKAGDNASSFSLRPGEAIRIFTGGMVPQNASAVTKQEIVEEQSGQIKVTGEILAGDNIRPEGEQVRKGETAIKKGTRLSPGTIGYLAGLGIGSVHVTRDPEIAIIVTGNELIPVGQELTPGKIYESNAVMLQAALRQYGFTSRVYHVTDNYERTLETISEAINSCHLLLLSGGISVGDYDFVARALDASGVETVFHKIRQKPGKPVYFGRTDSAVVFALPGNPSSALTCFYVYVLRALEKLSGRTQAFAPLVEFRMKEAYSKRGNFTHFLKAKALGGEVHVLPAQSSAMLSAFAEANSILIVPEELNTIQAGATVQAYLIH